MTKWYHTGGNDDDYGSSSPLVMVAAMVLSDSDLEVPFAFRVKEDVVTAVGYTKLSFVVCSYIYLLVLLGFSS